MQARDQLAQHFGVESMDDRKSLIKETADAFVRQPGPEAEEEEEVEDDTPKKPKTKKSGCAPEIDFSQTRGRISDARLLHAAGRGSGSRRQFGTRLQAILQGCLLYNSFNCLKNESPKLLLWFRSAEKNSPQGQ